MVIQIRLVIFLQIIPLHQRQNLHNKVFLEEEVKKVELFIIFSPDKTRELQRLDTQLHEFIKYLDTGILPQNQKKARCILLESSDCALINGLWHSRVARSKRM